MLNSYYLPLTPVNLPYQGRQMYMHSFDIADPVMAEGYEDYLPIVTSLLRSAGQTFGTAHMTVDEKIVQPGMSQRRPGPHVDGCFMPEKMRWGGGGGGGWNHYCNNVPFKRMAIIVAASVAGCKVWRGLFEGQPTDDGDVAHLMDQVDNRMGEVVPANHGYLLSPDCIHESMIFNEPTQRTFLRIALPVENEYASASHSNSI